MSDTTSFIVVGAGSAGCVVANRLSENGKHSVLLAEAGGSDLNFWVRIPIGYGRRSSTKRSTGNIKPSPTREPIAAEATGRAAKFLAVPVRSMPWSTFADRLKIMKTGKPWGMMAGADMMCCRIPRKQSAMIKETANSTARRDHYSFQL